ncbi:MAG: DUF1579 family protein [Steroidobacteraceae bacterium]
MTQPAITSYGDRSSSAPSELGTFSFLIGKWEGRGKVKLPDGKLAEFPVSLIGRYILDGTAIADELHSLAPDGSPYLGISLRQYDSHRKTWVVEYLNVSNSFIRRQVNASSGSVRVNGKTVTVTSESPETISREHYRVADHDNFDYSIDLSTDGGNSWTERQIEMAFRRV